MMRRIVALVIGLAVVVAGVPVWAEDDAPPSSETLGRTPPRLSFIDGEVSFWRPGADDWAPARLNTAIAPGDALYTGTRANLELQIGARAFVRAGEETQVGLENQEPDFIQFKVTAGHASLDLRSLAAGQTVELNTPHAAFTIEHVGYYRVNVEADATTLITRRGGRATVSPAGGEAVSVSPSEQVVIEGTETARVESYVAPELDDWDHWNYERTDHLIDAVSARYVAPGIYGVDALDHYGSWRTVPSYGPVWVPDGVGEGWVPYSTGRWMWDSYYGWTWVDEAPWGWAPYHHGRWVFTDGFWAWAPGPLVVRPVYAPALVAFFGDGGFAVHVGGGTPAIGWVALGWGEPLVPWWGPVGFVGAPWWAGWGGPRVVNNVVINQTTIVNVTNITTYQNVSVRNAVVAMRHDRFGREPVRASALAKVDVHRLEPIRGVLSVKPAPASMAPSEGRGTRPPEQVLKRAVVATRAPQLVAPSLPASVRNSLPAGSAPPPRIVSPPVRSRPAVLSPRPPFGQESTGERARPAEPPRFGSTPQAPERIPAPPQERPETGIERRPHAAPALPHAEPPVSAPRPPAAGAEMPRRGVRELPGEPANRLPPGRSKEASRIESRAPVRQAPGPAREIIPRAGRPPQPQPR